MLGDPPRRVQLRGRPARRRAPAAQAQAASQAATGGRQAVPVRRGPITDQLTLTGRVAAADEVLLGFGITGKVETVDGEAGRHGPGGPAADGGRVEVGAGRPDGGAGPG